MITPENKQYGLKPLDVVLYESGVGPRNAVVLETQPEISALEILHHDEQHTRLGFPFSLHPNRIIGIKPQLPQERVVQGIIGQFGQTSIEWVHEYVNGVVLMEPVFLDI